jgi:hypothetical protein
VYTSAAAADRLIELARSFGVAAQVIGHVESAPSKSLEILLGQERLQF